MNSAVEPSFKVIFAEQVFAGLITVHKTHIMQMWRKKCVSKRALNILPHD